MDLFGKENSVTERTKPTLVKIGNRYVISTGRWNNDCIANFVLAQGRDRWISVGELAKTAYGQNMPRTKERVRKCLHQLFRYLLLNYSELMVTEYDKPRNRATAIKLYCDDSELDQQSIATKLDRMHKRKEISAEQYDAAVSILQTKQGELNV